MDAISCNGCNQFNRFATNNCQACKVEMKESTRLQNSCKFVIASSIGKSVDFKEK